MFNKLKNKQDGFVLVVALMLLLTTTIMGTLLVINATTQSKMTREGQIKHQAFLGSETGIQASIKYLQSQIDNNDYLLNGASTFDTICNFPLTNFYNSNNLPFKYAYKTPNPVTLDVAMGLTNDSVYASQQFEYFLSVLGQTSGSGSGAGGSVGIGAEYSGVGAANATEYRIISCGVDTNTNARSILEVLVEAN